MSSAQNLPLFVTCPHCGVKRPFGNLKTVEDSGIFPENLSEWKAGVQRQPDGTFDMMGFCRECDTKIVFKLNPKRDTDARIIAHYVAAVGVPGVPIDEDELRRRAEQAVQFRGQSPPDGNVSVTLPLDIFAFFCGKKYVATFNAPDNVVYDGCQYASASMAARAVADGVNKNGWVFWSFVDPVSGDAVPLASIRREVERDFGPVRDSRRRTTLPLFDDRFPPVEPPSKKLPIRNRQGLCAEYFIDPDKPDSGVVFVYLYVSGELGKAVYDNGKLIDSRKFGIFNSWQSCWRVVSRDAHENGYVRVRVNDGGFVPQGRDMWKT